MATDRRPHILWIISDQHNANCMGHMGRNVRTPHLDAIAERGARFTQAFCNNPICAPSRISFITGQYCHTHRHLGNNIIDYPEGNPNTLSALARRHGYQTALIGKGHMIRAWDEEGFEHIRYCDLCDADRSDVLSHHYFRYLHEHGLAELYDLGTLPKDHPGKGTHWFVSPIPHEHSLEVWTGKETVKFLEGRDRRRPFFAQMSFQRPHAPLSPSPERADLYAPQDLDIPDSARDLFERGFATKPEFQRRHVARRGGYPYVPADPDELRRQLAHYYALITIIDEEIGRVLDHLRQAGDLDNTIIVYVADHGDFAGDHGLMQKNFGIYESIHRIPFLLAYPGCPAGREVPELIESIDLYPTICALADLPLPDGLEGQSLVPLIEQGAPGKEAAICEWSWMRPNPMIHALRTRDFRLVYYGAGLEGELYDRRADPDELVNLYADPAHRDVRLALTEQLLDRVLCYTKKSDLQRDAAIDHETRNTFARLIHKGMRNWSEIEGLYEE
jgi:choline-sulfatase/uncharacterized sulfatase